MGSVSDAPPPVPPPWPPEGWPHPDLSPQAPVPPYGAPQPPQPVAPPVPPYAAAGGPPSSPYGGPYAAPYVASTYPEYGATLSPAPARRSPLLGVVAAVAAGVAVLTSVVAAIAGFQVGIGAGREIAQRPVPATWDWTILTPVRDWVLAGEVSFWVGTVLGVWALIQGIVSIVVRRGRVAGIVAVVLAIVAPLLFGSVAWAFGVAGLGAGGSIGG